MRATINWKDSARFPRDASNNVPSYAVVWDCGTRKDGTVRRLGNTWHDKRKAEAVYRAKEAKGLRPEASVYWIAGSI